MKVRIFAFAFFLAAVASVHADTAGYAQCGTYDSYLLLYKTTQKFEELGKLRCGEKLEVVSHAGGYSQVRTVDGRLGWVRDSDLSDAPPPPQEVYTFGLSESSKPAVQEPAPKRTSPFLTNEAIVAMHRQHPGSDFILKTIKSSRCDFDTAPEAILKLKATGLSDTVILAMLEAPVASQTSEMRTPETVGVTVPDGTSIEVELKGDVSSEELQEGAIVEMTAAEDLVVNGVPVVVRGSAARARILAIKEPGSHGGGGEVAWFMQDIVSTSGERIPVTFAAKQPDNNKTKNFEGYPFFLTGFHKGSPAIPASDRRFRAVVHGDTILTISQSYAANAAAPKPKPQSMHHVSTEPGVGPDAAAREGSSAQSVVKP